MVGFRVPGYVATLVRCPNVQLLEPGHAAARDASGRSGPTCSIRTSIPVRRCATALAAITAGREIGEALLDQRIVCGIGNVYKSESLFLAGVDPWRPVGSLSANEADRRSGDRDRACCTRAPSHRGPISTYDPPGWLPSRGPSGQNWVYGRHRQPLPALRHPRPRPRPGRRPPHDLWCPSCQR